MRPVALLAGILVVAALFGCAATDRHAPPVPLGPGETLARGVVFDDRNASGTRDAGERGLGGVRVSNGRQVVRTDRDGRYALPVSDDTILFVIKPRGWMTPVDTLNLPRFCYIHKPAGTPPLKYPGVAPTGPLPESVDFALRRRPEPDRFDVLLFGDTQTRSRTEVDYLAHDVLEPLVGCDAAFGMSLGDLVFDKLDVAGPLNRAIAHLGIPFYNVLGNHDQDYEAVDDRHADDHFEAVYGPSYYSFDYGPVHFIVLDDVIWHGATADKKGHYTPGLGPAQLEFLRNDLALVPRDQLVVLTMHIPPVEKNPDRKALFALLADHPHVVAFSAHWHAFEQQFLDAADDWPGARPLHSVVLPTTCGSWWKGAPDELGIPHTMMPDGGPNGWVVATFAGHEFSFRFVPARRPPEYQLHVFTPDPLPAGQVAETEVVVNVFAGNERTRVELSVDGGPWTRLAADKRNDPYFMALKQLEQEKEPPRGRKLPDPHVTPHIWVGRLPAGLATGSHLLEVRATDMFGRKHVTRRIVRVVDE